MVRVPERRNVFDRREDILLLSVIELGEGRSIHRGKMDVCRRRGKEEEKEDESEGLCSGETVVDVKRS